MGFAKLREWVGTVTGKGDRWGRDRLGRSEPAFLSANISALPPLTCAARGRSHRQLLLFAARPANCGPFVGCEACAGRRIRWLSCLQLPCSAGGVACSACSAGCVCLQCLFCRLCLPACHPLPAMPTALHKFLPRSFCLPPFCSLCFAPVHCHVRQDHHR